MGEKKSRRKERRREEWSEQGRGQPAVMRRRGLSRGLWKVKGGREKEWRANWVMVGQAECRKQYAMAQPLLSSPSEFDKVRRWSGRLSPFPRPVQVAPAVLLRWKANATQSEGATFVMSSVARVSQSSVYQQHVRKQWGRVRNDSRIPAGTSSRRFKTVKVYDGK